MTTVGSGFCDGALVELHEINDAAIAAAMNDRQIVPQALRFNEGSPDPARTEGKAF